jgi:hypothetical protein
MSLDQRKEGLCGTMEIGKQIEQRGEDAAARRKQEVRRRWDL